MRVRVVKVGCSLCTTKLAHDASIRLAGLSDRCPIGAAPAAGQAASGLPAVPNTNGPLQAAGWAPGRWVAGQLKCARRPRLPPPAAGHPGPGARLCGCWAPSGGGPEPAATAARASAVRCRQTARCCACAGAHREAGCRASASACTRSDGGDELGRLGAPRCDGHRAGAPPLRVLAAAGQESWDSPATGGGPNKRCRRHHPARCQHRLPGSPRPHKHSSVCRPVSAQRTRDSSAPSTASGSPCSSSCASQPALLSAASPAAACPAAACPAAALSSSSSTSRRRGRAERPRARRAAASPPAARAAARKRAGGRRRAGLWALAPPAPPPRPPQAARRQRRRPARTSALGPAPGVPPAPPPCWLPARV